MNTSQSKIKSLTAYLLALILALTSFPFSVNAAELTTGSCGFNATYSFDSATGTLTISGTGGITNYGTGESPFYNNQSIKSVVIEEGITALGTRFLENNNYLESITIPESVTFIDKAVISNCSAISSVSIPSNVSQIVQIPFEKCFNLSQINVSSANTDYSSVDGVLFNKSKTELVQYPLGKTDGSYTVPDTVSEIKTYAFMYCENLKSVVFPSGLKTIGTSAFDHSGLTDVEIPESMTRIYSGSFSHTSLTDVILPENISSVEAYAFFGCSNLNSVTILNKDCDLSSGNGGTFCKDEGGDKTVIIKSFANSTAQAYAENYGKPFTAICTDGTENHDFTETTTATCTENGTKTYTCNNCGYTYTEDDAAIGHQWGEWEFDESTKTHSRVCENDNSHTEQEDCSFDEGVVTKEASCTEEGETTFTCSVCGGTYTESIEKTAHEYTAAVTAPTCTEQGYTTYTCSACGDSYTGDYMEATGHQFEENKPYCLNGCGEANPDYKEPETEPTTEPEAESKTEPATEPEEEGYTGPHTTDYADFRIIPGCGQIKVAWTNDEKIEEYEIYLSTNGKDFEKKAVVKTENANYYIINSLSKGRLYYVKIKGYLTYNEERIEMEEYSETQALTVK